MMTIQRTIRPSQHDPLCEWIDAHPDCKAVIVGSTATITIAGATPMANGFAVKGIDKLLATPS